MIMKKLHYKIFLENNCYEIFMGLSYFLDAKLEEILKKRKKEKAFSSW